MSQKIFLTSALAMGVFAPAFAEMTDSNTFPDASQGEYMQANTRYIGAATSDNMDGVYENNATVNAVAEYIDDLYTIVAGQYLPAGAESPIDCNQSGYFCAGVQNGVYYDANNNQGLTSCSDATNGAYTLSAGTGDSVNSCYRECTNADVAHSTGTMNGGYYYGNNNQCEPTDCVNGWHVKPGLNLTSTIGVSEQGNGYTANRSTGANYETTTNMSNTIIANAPLAFAVDYGIKGMLIGQARCSTQPGSNGFYTNGNYDNNGDWSNITKLSSLTDETGQEGAQWCYCNVTGYIPNGGTLQAVLSPWVFKSGGGGASDCARDCARGCAYNMWAADSYYLAFRAEVFGSVQPGLAMCEANVININWSNADANDISANNAGTATYGSDVRTPVKAQTIKGKTFRGWRFSKPEQTNLP